MRTLNVSRYTINVTLPLWTLLIVTSRSPKKMYTSNQYDWKIHMWLLITYMCVVRVNWVYSFSAVGLLILSAKLNIHTDPMRCGMPLIVTYIQRETFLHHPEKYFRNLVGSKRNQIVFTILLLIWNQTRFSLTPNQSENGKNNLISVWFEKIAKIFACVYGCSQHLWSSLQSGAGDVFRRTDKPLTAAGEFVFMPPFEAFADVFCRGAGLAKNSPPLSGRLASFGIIGPNWGPSLIPSIR